MRLARICSAFVFVLSVAVPAAAQAPRLTAAEVAAWRSDLDHLGRELRRIHPDPFTRISEAGFDSALHAVQDRLPTLRRTEAVVALAALVASIRDGHTTLSIGFDPQLGLRYYPVELYWFEDGIFVRKVAPGYDALVGARVVGLGTASIDEAIAAVAPTISRENEWWVRAWAPFRLMIPELLDGLGLVEDMERLPLVVELEGRRDTVIVSPAGPLGTAEHTPQPIPMSGWRDMADGAPTPLWLRTTDRPYWAEYRAADRLLYVGYNAIVSAPPEHGESNAAFWHRVLALADSVPVERLVIDLRHNSGGNRFLNRTLVRGLLRRPALDRPEVLRVLIGRRTFSAGVNLVNDLEYWTEALFVGEPTGMQPAAFGDHVPVRLPGTGVTVMISSLRHQNDNPLEDRSFVPPDRYAPLRSADYRAGRDPALELAMQPRQRPLIDELAAAIKGADTAQAVELLHAAITAEANRFRSIEAEINTLGYRFLNTGHHDEAIRAFQLNTRFYSRSANAFDSLGEALAQVGRRDEAIAAYERALALDPEFGPSREGLARLR